MQTNTNTLSLPSYARIVPLLALVLTVIWPKYALAFADIAQPAVLYFDADQTFFTSPIAASYLFEEGTILAITTSAYSSEENQTDGNPFTTASGSQVRQGVAAANFLPIGTQIRLGTQTYTIEDRLNARYNNTFKVDIWMDSTEAALQHGVRHNSIEIISLP